MIGAVYGTPPWLCEATYLIDNQAGAPAAAAGNPQPRFLGPNVTDRYGEFMFLPGESWGIGVYSIDSTQGTLTAVAGSPCPGGTAPVASGVEPSNHFFFVVNTDPYTGALIIPEFSTASTGALSPPSGSTIFIGDGASALAFGNEASESVAEAQSR